MTWTSPGHECGTEPGPQLTAAHRSPRTVHFGCPLCRLWSAAPGSALGQELDCPRCGLRLKLNPFTIDADWRPIARAWGNPV